MIHKYISFISLVIFSAAGCAVNTAYYGKINGLVAMGRYDDAASLNERSQKKLYGDKNLLLYSLDRAMLLQLAGKYGESNEYFEKAKAISDEYFRKNIATAASTWLISENTRPYYGEDFERALIHIFEALNYTMLGNGTEALVEARQADHFLKTLEVNYGRKAAYKEDAFSRYLMGMLYENEGQLNDAYISYYKSLEAYDNYYKNYKTAAPADLVRDALRLGNKFEFNDDVKKIKSKWPGIKEAARPGNYGEIVVINYNGFAPEKIDYVFEISFGKAWAYVDMVQAKGQEEEQVERAGSIARAILSSEQLRIAFPAFSPMYYTIKSFSIDVLAPNGNTAESSNGALAEDIGAIAKKDLSDRIALIRVKAIARAAIKFALAHKISDKVEENSDNETLGWITKKILTVAATLTEQADKRSWRTLPDKIFIARIALPEGEHSIKVNYLDESGSALKEEKIANIKVKAGKKTFIIVRSSV